ncbi:hypothetical protein PCANC_22661, partial [Puccinia coronata f. sp. avenae]
MSNATINPFLETSISYQAGSIASLVRKRDFDEAQWTRYTVPYLSRFMLAENAEKIAKENLTRWLEIDKERYYKAAGDDDDDPTEKIVNLTFSLAYGGLLLLNHTVLQLRRGWRYGVCGANGCGKSTLLKAINRHQIENFPESVSTFYVEHDIDGEDADLTCLQFLIADKFVKAKNLTPDQISERMREFGFDDARQACKVQSLSGGWKMRLALARAMLCEADLLLLDEPTNHLDRASIEWLQDYLKAQTKVTILTVSHDSGFLDSICTDIIHYQNKQLVTTVAIFPSLSRNTPLLEATTLFGRRRTQWGWKINTDQNSDGETVPDSGKIEKHPNLPVTSPGDTKTVMTVNQAMKASRVLSRRGEKTNGGTDRREEWREAQAGNDHWTPEAQESFQYEVKWKNLDHRHNTWLPREKLMEAGFGKLVQEHDDLEAPGR